MIAIPSANSDGFIPFYNGSIAGTATAIKASARAKLYALQVENKNASIAYLQIFDVALAASVTLGTTVPTKSIPIKANDMVYLDWADIGVRFLLGLQIAGTTTAAGATGVGTGLIVNADYA